ncbi:hexokinase type 2-like [Sitophilus oryzae]|uniref:Phosphotransferase n=1 Tax=Sitophilus oryzae TaxID=7048 RepID=A0A6J2YGE3_SITOR|nr:hexokinase type 2-like [Sitophilus oryzae]
MSCKSKKCNPPGGGSIQPGDGKTAEMAEPVHIGPGGVRTWYDPRITPEVFEGMKETWMDDAKIQKVMQLFQDNIERGLKKATHKEAIVKCFPTYVQDLPNGTEVGKFLALDLGGTNFRVLLVELDAGKCDMKSKIYAVPQNIMVGPGAVLFDHIAECLADFVHEHKIQHEVLPLGFTFSFPLEQRGLCVGILERWTKGFNCPDVIGKDVVELLNQAIDRRDDVKIDVCAVLNDTTGTLMSCAWKNPNCRIGLIVGTGNNGCYVEKQKNAELFDEADMGSGNVIINLEMGAFGDDGCLDFVRTEVDRTIDDLSINRGRQQHEKMISGMYMGEMVRRYIVQFTEKGLMFGGKASDALKEQDRFSCAFVSDIESDQPRQYTRLRDILRELDLSHGSEQDCINVRYICECLSRRSAHLISAAMVVLLHRMGESNVTIGVDGSVYKHHPHFRRLMIQKMSELVRPGISFDIMLSEDGSGRGAALVAAVAARKKAETGK